MGECFEVESFSSRMTKIQSKTGRKPWHRGDQLGGPADLCSRDLSSQITFFLGFLFLCAVRARVVIVVVIFPVIVVVFSPQVRAPCCAKSSSTPRSLHVVNVHFDKQVSSRARWVAVLTRGKGHVQNMLKMSCL